MKISTKEEIFNEAFLLFKKEGLKTVTARKVAKELSCSTTVIYSHYSSMEELKSELIESAKEIFLSYVKTSSDKLDIFNISFGICTFAKENQPLFNTIFLEKECFTNFILEIDELLKKDIYKNIEYCEERKILFENYWIYVYGLSALIAKDLISFSDEDIKERITKMLNLIFC